MAERALSLARRLVARRQAEEEGGREFSLLVSPAPPRLPSSYSLFFGFSDPCICLTLVLLTSSASSSTLDLTTTSKNTAFGRARLSFALCFAFFIYAGGAAGPALGRPGTEMRCGLWLIERRRGARSEEASEPKQKNYRGQDAYWRVRDRVERPSERAVLK